MKKKLISIVFALLVFTGCSAKLSEDKEMFSDKGISYSIQLPTTWETTKDFKNVFGEGAIFGASDKKSNSSMYVSTKRIETVDMKDFAAKTRAQLSKVYGYENEKELYMKEFELNGHQAYKYTAFTKFNEKDAWVHLYYIVTDNALAQVVFYSADDGSYEKRSEILDESAKSFKQTEITEESWKEETASSSEETEDGSVKIKNNNYSFTIKGARTMETEDNKKLIIIRYTFANLGEDTATPQKFEELVKVNQGENSLNPVELPESEKTTEEGLLIQQKNVELEKGTSVDTLAIYELNDMSSTVLLKFSKDQFPDQEDIALPIGSEN